MDSGKLDKAASFTREIVRFEKKKLILPVLIILIFSSSIVISLELRDNQKIDEKITNASTKSIIEDTVILLEHRYYPNASGLENESDVEKAREKLDFETDYSKQFILMSPAFFGVEYPLIPLTPSDGFSGSGGIIFRMENGYIISKEFYESPVENLYYSGKLGELENRINNSNTSYEEFTSQVESIVSARYEDQKVRDYYANEDYEDTDSNIYRGGPASYNYNRFYNFDKFEQRLIDDELREVQLVHFVPSILATFILYYLVSGLIVESSRVYRRKIEDSSKDENFFRKNLTISFLVTLVIISVFKGLKTLILPHSGISELLLLLGSAVLWTILFGLTASQIKKKSRYRWIIAGINLNVLLFVLPLLLPRNLQNIITGATLFYPLLLGITAEYGRIHGEKFLREELEDD